MKIIKKDLTFGTALNALLRGNKVTRSIWNTYLFISNKNKITDSAIKNGNFLIVDCANINTQLASKHDLQNYAPHNMATPKNTMIVAKLSNGYIPAWLCQVDMLAHDWEIVR